MSDQNDIHQQLFNDNYKKVLKIIRQSNCDGDKDSDRDLNIDKWDIFAGIILAGAITATIVGISVASYYIIIALTNAGLIALVGGLITAQMKDNFSDFIKKELRWVFEYKLVELAEEKTKDLHSKIKGFLIKHFETNTNLPLNNALLTV